MISKNAWTLLPLWRWTKMVMATCPLKSAILKYGFQRLKGRIGESRFMHGSYFDFCGALTVWLSLTFFVSVCVEPHFCRVNQECKWRVFFVSCSHLITIDLWKSMISGFATPKKQFRFMALMADRKEAPKARGIIPTSWRNDRPFWRKAGLEVVTVAFWCYLMLFVDLTEKSWFSQVRMFGGCAAVLSLTPFS